MFSDTDAKTIIDEHKKTAQFASAADLINARKENVKEMNVNPMWNVFKSVTEDSLKQQ